MIPALLWMVTDFENATSEDEHDKEIEPWSGFSILLHLLLPVAGLALFFKQKHIFSRMLLQLDRNCLSVFCPSLSKREKLLKWAGSRLPETWSSQSRTLSSGISELWIDGSLLCTLISSAIPGACLNPHRHWKKPPLHAQAIAFKYLGVVPVFTDKDFSGELTVTLERNFLHYLNELQQAINRITEGNELNRTTSGLYVARGMGLYTGEQHRRTTFYVYPNVQPTILNNTNIIIHIRGPYGTYGKAIIPKFHNDLFSVSEMKVSSDLRFTKNLMKTNLSKKNPFMKSFSLPFMQYHKKHMGDNIVIHVTMEDDRAKVTYIPKNHGMYEIMMISNGELITGCPFNVHILQNTSGIEETLETEEKEEEVPHTRRRKIISKTIDFVNEQMAMTDLQKRYHTNEENQRIPDNFKDVKEITDEDHSTKEAKKNYFLNVSDSVNDTIGIQKASNLQDIHRRESFKLQQKDSKIVEEEEEVLPQQQINYKDNALKTNNDNLTDDQSNILEKQNLESVNENYKNKILRTNKYSVLNDSRQPQHGVYNVNCFTEKEILPKIVGNGDTTDIGLVRQKTVPESNTDNGEKERKTNIANGNLKTKLTFNEYPKPIVVKKIRIPEKFCTPQNIPSKENVSKLDKYVKNVINNSNKSETPRNYQRSTTVQEDDINRTTKRVNQKLIITSIEKTYDDDSGNDTISSLEDNEVKQNLVKALSRETSTSDVKKANAIPRRFFQCQAFSKENVNDNANSALSSSLGRSSTSPICNDHIGPEVNNEFRRMTVAERRKIFACESSQRISNSTNSSFSENENTMNIQKPLKYNRQIEGLSVLNFLGSLKQTEADKTPSNYVLCSTKSLPNISSFAGDYIFRNSVKERKNFWETLSTSSSTLNADHILKKSPKKMTEEERLRLIWKKPENLEKRSDVSSEKTDLEKVSEISKSADDIMSISYVSNQSQKKYKSYDDALDDCIVLSIEERKKILLKEHYENEKVEKAVKNVTPKRDNMIKINNTISMKIISEEKNQSRNNGTEDEVAFNPIVEKIKKYDSAWNLTRSTRKGVEAVHNKVNKQSKVSSNNDTHDESHEVTKPPKMKLKSHFKKAIQYFKRLEEKSLGRPKTKIGNNDSRKYHLDFQSNKVKKKRRGGSLNLPNVSERFSLSNLYDDVLGNRKGSFRGAANRSGLVEALATFSRKENITFTEDNEDDIKYDIFKKRTKRRTRKSVKSVFDVYY